MQQQSTLRIAADTEEQHRTDVESSAEPAISEETLQIERAYEQAEEVDVSRYSDEYSFTRFVSAVLEELGKDYTDAEARLVDEIDDPDDVHFGILLALPDDSLLFVGSDPTANDAIPWFAFCIERYDPMPAPATAQEALDLLKPPDVKDIEHDLDWLPDRHGEWWLIPTELVPGGEIHTPGVASRPFGPSPLGNHVPREWAATVPDDAFLETFHENVESAPSSIRTMPEAIEWTWRQTNKRVPPEDAPTWADIRDWAGDIIVRGTVRHRDNDHFVENCGDVWHKAVTHDVEVYTGDGIAERIHLDYHGR